MPYPPGTVPPPIDSHVATISGGLHLGAPSRNDQKRYLSELDHDHEVCALVQTPAQCPKLMNFPITFTEDNAQNVYFPHHDPLVIDAQIGNKMVSRVLVDDRSSVNVLFKPAFTAIGLTEAYLASCATQIYGFNGDSILPMGKIQLPVTLGNKIQGSFKFCMFVVVDCFTAYNVIFSCPALVDFGAITSICHLCMKFPCDNGGVGTVRGDQKSAQKCYHISARPIYMVCKEPLEEENDDPIPPPPPAWRVIREEDELDLRIGADKALEPMEEVEEVCISGSDSTRVIQVGRNLNLEVKAAIIARKQKPLGEERAKALRLEVEKLSLINFIQEALYPILLVNPVLVPKPNETWRTCIDFTDLNKACLKDCFPLPRIDQTVDAKSEYEILSFMDAYSSYNQISMHVVDQKYTSF
ncbi:uncharacterized protein LOC133778922 [Humulus lupulus]|uniref:uncharacterized protein LOC133778922 n=1 Tax=Humulus lupulus TaxID=3486 RepID=UPI002B409CC3|nr:uncharacterized protein LOC133778922 [Humulus lupulus]